MTGDNNLKLNDDHLDFLKELFTIGAGKSSEILSEMLGTHIQLSIPLIQQLTVHEVSDHFSDLKDNQISLVDLQFKGEINGDSMLIFPQKSARLLGNILLEQDEDEDFDSAKIGVLTEVGNIVLNSIMGTISNFMKIRFDYLIPVYQNQFKQDPSSDRDDPNNMILLANTHFTAEDISIEGDIALLFSLKSVEYLTSLMDSHLNEL